MKYMRLAALYLFTLPMLTLAQSTTPQQKSVSTPTPARGVVQKPKPVAPKTTKEIDPEVAQRRSIALGSLTTLAIEARSFRDEALRARVQARIADALWEAEPESARSLFRRAWDAAEAFETQPLANLVSAPERFTANRTPAGARPRTNLRAEVLKLAAGRDHALGEELLRRMTAARREQETASASSDPILSEAEIRERLRLANEFLESDNVQRALQFADPALLQVTGRAISFLTALRAKNPIAADQRFSSLLARASADPGSDANTVSQLTTYAFTPWITLVVSPSGIPSSNSYPPGAAPDLPPAIRSAFFRVAADILLRPFAQLEQSSAGRAGTYFMAARLLPLFQQHAPELAPAISAQLTALGPEAAQAARSAGDRSLNRGMNAETSGLNVADDLKDRLERARTADERDRAYAFAAMGTAESGDPGALDFVEKIEDLETRKGIRGFVEYRLIRGYLQKNNVDDALKLARKSSIPHQLRANVLIKAAGILAKTDSVRANEILEEALGEARRVNANTPERAYTLVSLLANFANLNRARAWELVAETVKAGNADASFSGENGNTRWMLEGKFSIAMGAELAAPTDLAESFAMLAQDDFYQAMDVSRNFTAEAPRAIVAIAIARATLAEKKEKLNSKR